MSRCPFDIEDIDTIDQDHIKNQGFKLSLLPRLVELLLLKMTKISWLSRCNFFNVEIETLDQYHIQNQDFSVSKLVNVLLLKLRRISILSRCRFWNCQKLLDCQDVIFDTFEIETISIIDTLGCQNKLTCCYWNWGGFLYCRDVTFETVKDYLTVKMLFF